MPDYRSAQALAATPRRLAVALEPHTRPLAEAIVREVRREVPEYSGPPEGRFGRALAEGIEVAVRHCFQCIGNPHPDHSEWVRQFRRRGRREFDEGRTLDALQAAVRIGGRVAWQYLTPVLRELGAGPQTLTTAAEAIFAFVDELSATALEGFQEARQPSGAEERRRRLATLILAEPQPSLAGPAEAAGWPLPERVAVIALEHAENLPAGPLDDEVLADLDGDRPCLITPSPQRTVGILSGNWEKPARAAVSPPVPLVLAPAAHRLARRGLALPGDVVWCAEHLDAIWLRSQDFLADRLQAKYLAPLDSVSGRQRARLGETLLAWLETRGGAPEIARRLQVHPQTVRARLHQLRELFGDRLDDADTRFGLHLVLRRQLGAEEGTL
ncbi:PucR family transcriptional regulator [Amycolatopsis thermoflava]|uniref:PucR family transcriptional regulator n=1 Tax=Amycolatopsis thermoflava TaxID=84480 RepID=UPI003651E66C